MQFDNYSELGGLHGSIAAAYRWCVHGNVRRLETFADELRDMVGLDHEEIVDAGEFAIRLVGRDSVVVLRRLADGARLRQTEDGYRIEIRDGLPDINFACARQVACWALREVWQYVGAEEDRLAAYLGAALLMPSRMVRRVVDRHGTEFDAIAPLATRARVSKTAAQLRLAEVIGDERGVVTKTGNVLVRNAARVDWEDPSILDTRTRGVHHLALAKTRLSGGIDAGRVALKVRSNWR